MSELEDIERDLTELWSNFRVRPTHLRMSLGNWRKIAAQRDDLQDYAVKFLEETRNIDDNAVVVFTPGKMSLLVDIAGNLLRFS